MRTLASLLFATVGLTLLCGSAQAQIHETNYKGQLLSMMEGSIQGNATPIMRVLCDKARAFTLTNKPDYKTNDVPYEFTVKASTLPGMKFEGVMLCPVSGHVNRESTERYRQGNESQVKLNGQVVATGQHQGKYVLEVPFSVQLKQGRNELVMFQQNPKSGERAYVGGFPMGRQFNITVTPNSGLRRAWAAKPWTRSLGTR